jgi:chromosome segregation ATPase
MKKDAKKIVTKKIVSKSYSGDEVKRYLGSLSEDFQHKVSAIGEQFGGLNIRIDSIDKKLDEHGRKLDVHTQMIGQLMTDVQEIKTDLRACYITPIPA